MTRSSTIKLLLVTIVGLVAREYAHYTYITQEEASLIVFSQQDRPFVYRTLVPWLAYGLTRVGLSPEASLTIIVICTAIGFLYGLNFLFHSFHRS